MNWANGIRNVLGGVLQAAPAAISPGMAAGFADAQQKQQQQQLELQQQHAKSLAEMYSHLASQPGIMPELQQQYMSSAQTAYGYNPLDPDSSKAFKKLTKSNPTDFINAAHQARMTRLQSGITSSPANVPANKFDIQPPNPADEYDEYGRTNPVYAADLDAYTAAKKQYGISAGKFGIAQQILEDPANANLSAEEHQQKVNDALQLAGFHVPNPFTQIVRFYNQDANGTWQYHEGHKDRNGNLFDEKGQRTQGGIDARDVHMVKDDKGQMYGVDPMGRILFTGDQIAKKVGSVTSATPNIETGGTDTSNQPVYAGGGPPKTSGLISQPPASAPNPAAATSIGGIALPPNPATGKPDTPPRPASISHLKKIQTPEDVDLLGRSANPQDYLGYLAITNPDAYLEKAAKEKGLAPQMRGWWSAHGLHEPGTVTADEKKGLDTAWDGLGALADIHDSILKQPAVGPLLGRFMKAANDWGSSKVMAWGAKMLSDTPYVLDGQGKPIIDPQTGQPKVNTDLLVKLAAGDPQITNPVEAANTAAYLITRMRAVNFMELRSLVAGGKGVTTLWEDFQNSMMNTHQNFSLIENHAAAMADQFGRVIRTIESRRWGGKVPPTADPLKRDLLDRYGIQLNGANTTRATRQADANPVLRMRENFISTAIQQSEAAGAPIDAAQAGAIFDRMHAAETAKKAAGVAVK